MSSPNHPTTSASTHASAKKPDLVSAPAAAALIACVVAAVGNSRGSALLTWQIPLALIVLSIAYVGLRSMRARR